jgi:hypothetical protein
VWEQLDGARDLKTLQDLLTREFDVSDKEAETDLLAFIADMQTISAVEIARG